LNQLIIRYTHIYFIIKNHYDYVEKIKSMLHQDVTKRCITNRIVYRMQMRYKEKRPIERAKRDAQN